LVDNLRGITSFFSNREVEKKRRERFLLFRSKKMASNVSGKEKDSVNEAAAGHSFLFFSL